MAIIANALGDCYSRRNRHKNHQSGMFVMVVVEGFKYQGLIAFLNKILSQKSRTQGIKYKTKKLKSVNAFVMHFLKLHVPY